MNYHELDRILKEKNLNSLMKVAIQLKQETQSTNILHSQSIMKLKSEKVRLQDATTYRKETADYALSIAKQKQDVSFFFRENNRLEWVERFFPLVDEERAKDITTYLRVITRDLAIQISMDQDMKKRIASRMKQEIILEKVEQK